MSREAICHHENFEATVNVHRMTKEERGPVTGYMAEVRIQCTECGKPFQFLGLEPGVDLQGARISIDGLEAQLALCPQYELPSPLDRIAVNFKPTRTN